MNTRFQGKAVPVIALLLVLLSGCANQQTRNTSSSVVDYLYPRSTETTIQPSVPVLNLPLRVGVAFVPAKQDRSRGGGWPQIIDGDSLTEARKTGLLETLAGHFTKHAFVSDMEIIPTAYLTRGGSFANLDQIRTMYDIDVIALVSYDQVQFTDEGFLSLTYWTLVGAYLVAGEKNDTSTMIDTVVYDIQSRKMLFRAPGTSNVKGLATPVNLSEELREDSAKGFELATEQMIANLDIQLAKFRERARNKPEQVEIVYSQGYAGGGSSGLIETFLLLCFSATTGLLRKFRQ